jgi:hypothetical protein
MDKRFGKQWSGREMFFKEKLMPKKIRITGKRQEKIVDTGTRLPAISPEEFAKAIGGEVCKEIPERFRAAAANPMLARRRKKDS